VCSFFEESLQKTLFVSRGNGRDGRVASRDVRTMLLPSAADAVLGPSCGQ
jgi:hypothetical protein